MGCTELFACGVELVTHSDSTEYSRDLQKTTELPTSIVKNDAVAGSDVGCSVPGHYGNAQGGHDIHRS